MPPLTALDNQWAIFKQAREFELAAIHLGNHRWYEIELPEAPPYTEKFLFVIAVAVNAAFSLELYLKCLLMIDSITPPKVHTLLDLFNLLPADQRRKIEELHDKSRALLWGEPPLRGASLLEILQMSNNAFDDWRYHHEDQKPLQFSAGPVIDHVKRVIFEASPPLEERLMIHLGLARKRPVPTPAK
jgi:hypothetical protein